MVEDGGEELRKPSKSPVRTGVEGMGAPGELQPPMEGAPGS